MNQRPVRFQSVLVLVALGVGLSGCASQVPSKLQRAPADNPVLEAVQAEAEQYRGHPVRWGGELVEVLNSATDSDLLILARPLDEEGEPRSDADAQGRFIARITGFVDPADYQAGQRITVFGKISGVRKVRIGDYVYPYPVIEVSDWYRWPAPRPVRPRPWWVDDPFYPGPFYDPFYDPWWPRTYGWPYHRYW